jgi:membrane dipeptidase
MSQSTPVFDYHAGSPWIRTDAVDEAVESAVADGESGREAYVRAEARALRESADARDRLREAYESAGVDVVSVTTHEDFWRWSARVDAVPWLETVTTPAEARDVAERDAVGLLLNTQDLGAQTADLDDVEELYGHGVRIAQLTYNRQNRLGTGCTDRSDGGLSNSGVDAVERLNDLGVVVDLSHCGRRTTLDAVEQSAAPVAYTHTCCRAVYDHDRGKTDEELEALAEADGYVGVVAVPFFLTDADDPSLDAFFDHLEHAVDVVGAERVGVGSDFSSVDAAYPEAVKPATLELMRRLGFREEHGVELGAGFGEMRTYADWGRIREGVERRFGDRAARHLLGESFLSFWERVRERRER